MRGGPFFIEICWSIVYNKKAEEKLNISSGNQSAKQVQEKKQSAHLSNKNFFGTRSRAAPAIASKSFLVT